MQTPLAALYQDNCPAQQLWTGKLTNGRPCRERSNRPWPDWPKASISSAPADRSRTSTRSKRPWLNSERKQRNSPPWPSPLLLSDRSAAPAAVPWPWPYIAAERIICNMFIFSPRGSWGLLFIPPSPLSLLPRQAYHRFSDNPDCRLDHTRILTFYFRQLD